MQVVKLKPNHICQNPNCHKGEFGRAKEYYSCNYCNRTQSWKSRYCSIECYLEDLGNKREAQRTDMNKEEYSKLMKTPVEDVKKQTLEELSDYKEYLKENGLENTIDLINEQIDSGDNHE